MPQAVPFKRPARKATPFDMFSKYENGRIRNLRFDVNALADFEEKTGMGFAQLMRQQAVFASARAMLWAGLKHEDRRLTIEDVGELLSDYLSDADVPVGTHTIDSILFKAVEASVEQGALGRRDAAVVEEMKREQQRIADPNSESSPETTSENSQTASGGPNGSSEQNS